jgi:hypothetical protein
MEFIIIIIIIAVCLICVAVPALPLPPSVSFPLFYALFLLFEVKAGGSSFLQNVCQRAGKQH